MYQLGEIRFEGLRGFDSLRKSNEAVYAEIPLMDGKPRLQRTGTALQAVSVTIALRKAFTDPTADVATLAGYRESGQVLTLVSGVGEVVGSFVIVSMDEVVEETTPAGLVITNLVTLSLKEFYDPNKPATIAAAAVSAAFAVGAAKVVPVRQIATVPTPMAVVSQSVGTGSSASKYAIENIRSSASNPAQKNSLFNKAKAALNTAQTAYEKAAKVASEVDAIAGNAPLLVVRLENLVDNFQTVKTAVASGDLTNALGAMDALETSVGAVNVAVGPINNILTLRTPQ